MTENDIYAKLTELVSEKTKVGELKPETDLLIWDWTHWIRLIS